MQKGLGNYLTYMFVISMKPLTRFISGAKEGGVVATLTALESVVHHHSSKPVVVTTIILVP